MSRNGVRMLRSALMIFLLFLASAASAHEFWISARDYRLPVDAPIVADIRVGENMKGASYSYLPPQFRRFDLVLGQEVTKVTGRAGDYPALTMTLPGKQGLVVVVHETSDLYVKYTEWQKFVNFTMHKGYPDAAERHLARGGPKSEFRERYSRYAKSLIALGDGIGQDRVVGLETEILALANPYTDDLSNGFPVQVLYDGRPRPGAQIELFAKDPKGAVAVTIHNADANGIAHLQVQSGFRYLVDSVVLVPLETDGKEDDPAWESLWASLTFAVP